MRKKTKGCKQQELKGLKIKFYKPQKSIIYLIKKKCQKQAKNSKNLQKIKTVVACQC